MGNRRLVFWAGRDGCHDEYGRKVLVTPYLPCRTPMPFITFDLQSGMMSPDRRGILETELRRLVGLWKKDPSVSCIILFGPLTQSGDIGDDSEIDLVIVQDTNVDFLERLEPFYAETRTVMDILVYTPDEFREMRSRNFLKHILEAGAVLYRAEPRVRGDSS